MSRSNRAHRQSWLVLVLIFCTAVPGCAPGYRCYRGCHVDCRYCPPPPLPYSSYNEHVCHSCPARHYLEERRAVPGLAAETGKSGPSEP